jgi:hypothetical protein
VFDVTGSVETKKFVSSSAPSKNQNAYVQGQISRHGVDYKPTLGRIYVNQSQMRFVPDRVTERAQGFELSYDAIEKLTFSGMKKQLTMQTAKMSIVLGGNNAASVYAVTHVLRRGHSNDRFIGRWVALSHHGPLAQKGELVATNRRLFFVPTGVVDTVVGATQHIDIPLSESTRMELAGLDQRRLNVYVEGTRFEFSLIQSNAVSLDKFLSALVNVDGISDPIADTWLGALTETEAAEIVAPWIRQLGFTPSNIQLCGPAVQVTSKPRLRRGWIAVTKKRVIFVPASTAGGTEHPVSMMLADVTSSDSDRARAAGRLALSNGNVGLVVVPRGGTAFIDRFWQLCHSEQQSMKTPLIESTGVSRREYERFELKGDYEVALTLSAERRQAPPRRIVCNALDLSCGGIGVMSAEPVELDTGVYVDFDFEFFKGSLAGIVVHQEQVSGEWRLGVEFTDLTVEHLEHIRATLNRVLPNG